jgi:hypothetical protein
VAVAWQDALYPKRQEILLDSPTGDLSDFPVLVVATDEIAIANADCASKRYRIYDWLGNLLSYDEDTYSEGASYVNLKSWASVPDLYASPAGDQNKVYLYYGYDPGSDQDDPTGAWDAWFEGVYHLGETSGTLYDSTSHNNDLTAYGSPTYGAAGPVGKGLTLAASSHQYLALGSAIVSAVPLTMELWYKPTAQSFARVLEINQAADPTQHFRLAHRGDISNYVEALSQNGGTYYYARSTAGSTNAAWNHAAAVFAAANSRTAYVNGGNSATDTGSVTPSGVNGTFVGAGYSPIGDWFDGDVDEVRISSVARPLAWLAYEVSNVKDADNAQTWGGEEASGTDYTQGISEALGLSDAASRVAGYARLQSENLGITDISARFVEYLREQADNAGISDSASRTAAFARDLAESAGIADTTLRLVDYARALADPEGLTDQTIRVAGFLRSIDDSEGLADLVAVLASVVYDLLISEAVGMTDSATRIAGYMRSVSDVEAVSDAVSRLLSMVRTISDSMDLQDAATRAANYLRTLSDGEGIADAFAFAGILVRMIRAISASLRKPAGAGERLRTPGVEEEELIQPGVTGETLEQ